MKILKILRKLCSEFLLAVEATCPWRIFDPLPPCPEPPIPSYLLNARKPLYGKTLSPDIEELQYHYRLRHHDVYGMSHLYKHDIREDIKRRLILTVLDEIAKNVSISLRTDRQTGDDIYTATLFVGRRKL